MDKLENNAPKNIYLAVIICSLVFGLLGGISGEIFSRSYITDQYFNTPLASELSLNAGKQGSNLIIRNPRNVVVEQDSRSAEVLNAIRSVTVGIYKKIIPATTTPDRIDPKNFYDLSSSVGQGIVITSDGWLMTNWSPGQGLALTDYVAITNDRQILPLNRLMNDRQTGVNFMHAVAHDLPVYKFASEQSVRSGQLLISANWSGDSFQSALSGFQKRLGTGPWYSDMVEDRFKLDNKIPAEMKGSILCSLNGEIAAFIDKNGDNIPIYRLSGMINTLLADNRLRRPSIGLWYINTSNLASAVNLKGALITKGPDGSAMLKNGPAAQAGLKEGDLITAFDGVEIDRDTNLNHLVSHAEIGSKATLTIVRSGR